MFSRNVEMNNNGILHLKDIIASTSSAEEAHRDDSRKELQKSHGIHNHADVFISKAVCTECIAVRHIPSAWIMIPSKC